MFIITFDTQEECDKFVLLYETYGKIVYYTLKKFNLDDYTIEDLSHDIYLKVADHLDDINIQDTRRTRNYFITISRNYCLNYLRKQKYTTIVNFDDTIDTSTVSEDVLENIISNIQLQTICNEINKLDEIYKIVLELKYVNNMNNEEIATFLQLKKKTVEMRLYRANKILKSRLKELIYD